MNISGYLSNGENVLLSLDAYDTQDSLQAGELVCTPNRIAFITEKHIIDIDTDRVDAVEYWGKRYPEKFALAAVLLLVIGAGTFVVSSELAQIPTVGGPVGLGLAAVGILLFLLGFLFQQARVVIHTPSESFEFFARDSSLADLPNAVRS